ncbi:MAG TPA: RIP metalloprotease RseP, partial [Rhodospirillaceae bacterium]|nr:RIP metalloprotease RseP [Rhodospirillaceae bacterium]
KIGGEKPFWIGVGGDDRFLVSPQRAVNADFDSQDYLALSDGREDIVMQYSPLQALGHATVEVWSTTTSTLQALGQMFTGARSATELGGLIRIGALAGDIAQKGFIALIMFSALLSVNLGLLNLFPIPVLDGGHLVFYAIEAASGKPVSEKAQDIAFRFGFGFLVAVMAFANINDIVQLFL